LNSLPIFGSRYPKKSDLNICYFPRSYFNLEYNLVVTLPAICHIITHFGPEMLIPNDSPLAERSARRRSNESHNNIILIALTFDRFEDHMPLGQNLIRRTKAFS